MIANKISIIVITKDRPGFFRRFAGTLNSMGFGGTLIVSNASDKLMFDAYDQVFAELNLAYRLEHLHVPKRDGDTISQSMNDGILQGIAKVNTDYAMLSCDDDIPVPPTLQRCQDTLDMTPDIESTVGEFPMVDVNAQGWDSLAKYNDDILNFYPTAGIESDSALGRYDEYVEHFFHTMFVVTRRHNLNYLIPDNFRTIGFPHFCSDYSWMFSFPIRGKIRAVDGPHIVRQRHDNNLGASKPFPKYVEGMVTPGWSDDAAKFINHLEKAVIDTDGISHEDARKWLLAGFAKLSAFRLYRKGLPNLKALRRDPRHLKRVKFYKRRRSEEWKLLQQMLTTMGQFSVDNPN